MLKEVLNNLSNQEIREHLLSLHPYDIAEALEDLSNEEREKLFNLLDNEVIAQVMTYIEPVDAALYLNDLDLDEQVDLINYMDPDDAVDIILEFEEEEQKEIIEELDDKLEIEKLITYEEDQAGAYMTSDFIELHPSMNVKEATKKLIKEAPNVESISSLYVIDENKRFLGVLSFKSLISAKMPLTVGDLYEKCPSYLDTDDVNEVISGIRHYGGYQMPITNADNILMGIITLDDAIDIYEEESIEDYEKLSALPQKETKNPFVTAIHRLPWLIGLLILSIPIAFVTSLFEEVIAAVVILALFQPLILDAGGDVATQTLAVTLITLNNKDGQPLKNGQKEIITGLINGFIMGLIAFVITLILAKAFALENVLMIALVVGISLWVTVFIGPIIGFLVPIALKRLNYDPAVASGPFITTLIDILSLLVYFGLATIMLGGLING